MNRSRRPAASLTLVAVLVAGTGCSGADQPDASSSGLLPDGTYRTTLTPELVRATCDPDDPRSAGMFSLTSSLVMEIDVQGEHIVEMEYPDGVDAGGERGYAGTYRTFRDTFELTEEGTGLVESMTFDFDGHRLLLSDLDSPYCDSRAVWTGHPWELLTPASE